jgi:hypothetical protein
VQCSIDVLYCVSGVSEPYLVPHVCCMGGVWSFLIDARHWSTVAEFEAHLAGYDPAGHRAVG